MHSGVREFRVHDNYVLNAARYRFGKDGVGNIRGKGVRWLTNIEHAFSCFWFPLRTGKEEEARIYFALPLCRLYPPRFVIDAYLSNPAA
jgi:hypothetical protein